jgi:1-deoxyxylulose-5-phosphate synthase
MLPATRIGLGCVTFGREIDEAASFALLDHALALGVKHFDTAAAYGGGASESILGKWLASRKPEGITVATKILPPYDRIDITPSLNRLGVEQIDLLYLHQWHETALQVGPLLGRLAVKQFGASNFTLEQLQAAEPLFRVVQNNHNLAVSDVSDAFRAHCAANGISIVTYSPLGAGFLTGKHQDGVQPGSRFEVVPGLSASRKARNRRQTHRTLAGSSRACMGFASAGHRHRARRRPHPCTSRSGLCGA